VQEMDCSKFEPPWLRLFSTTCALSVISVTFIFRMGRGIRFLVNERSPCVTSAQRMACRCLAARSGDRSGLPGRCRSWHGLAHAACCCGGAKASLPPTKGLAVPLGERAVRPLRLIGRHPAQLREGQARGIDGIIVRAEREQLHLVQEVLVPGPPR
jgi:hypothetical protein